MRIVRYGVMLGLLTLSSPAADAREREAEFESFMKSEVMPWSARGEAGHFRGVPAGTKPVQLHYKTFIHPKPKANVVMVHGFGERIDKYMELAYDFYQAGYSVFLYDQRGFGQSTRLLDNSSAVYVQSFEHYADDLRTFFDQVVIPKSSGRPHFIFAHSMGGAVTTLFLARHPNLVSRAVLSTPMHEMNLGGLPRWSALSLVSVGSKIGRGTSYAFGQGAPHFPETFEQAATQSQTRWKWFADYASRPEQRASALGGATNQWVLEAFGVTDQFMQKDFPKKISIPILLFQAGKDTWVGEKGQNLFCQQAPDCELIRYPDAKHEIYWEKDSLRTPYLQKILAFFART